MGELQVSKLRTNQANGIKVIVRLRPLIERASTNTNNTECLVQMKGPTTSVLPKDFHHREISTVKSSSIKHFTVDHALWSYDEPHENYATQQVVYEHCGEEFLNHTMEGYNTCIFAYGQTGAGKSYTMFGSKNDGLIPNIAHNLFSRGRALERDDTSVNISISYFEIYNEEVFDLLDTKSTMKKRVRENQNGPFVENLNEIDVKSSEEVFRYLREGSLKRKTASTKSNSNSSRSHAVVTINVIQRQFLAGQVLKEKTSHMRLVDLAGSERATSTGNVGMRLKEGSNINKSLTTLGRVLTILSEKSSQVVPYRDSCLTWLLKESIGGNSKSCMICCISPTDYEETISSLRYATLTKKIQTIAVVNDVSKKSQGIEELERLQVEERMKLNQIIDELKVQLDESESKEIVRLRNLIKFDTDLQKAKFFKMKSEIKERDGIIQSYQDLHLDLLKSQNNHITSNLNSLYKDEWLNFTKELDAEVSHVHNQVQRFNAILG